MKLVHGIKKKISSERHRTPPPPDPNQSTAAAFPLLVLCMITLVFDSDLLSSCSRAITWTSVRSCSLYPKEIESSSTSEAPRSQSMDDWGLRAERRRLRPKIKTNQRKPSFPHLQLLTLLQCYTNKSHSAAQLCSVMSKAPSSLQRVLHIKMKDPD